MNNMNTVNYAEIKFDTWQDAVRFSMKHNLWGSVTVVLEGDYYVIVDKR